MDHRYSILLCCANREKGIYGRLLTRESVAVNVPVITRLVGSVWEIRAQKEVQMSEREERRTTQGVEYESVGEEYLEQRGGERGAAGGFPGGGRGGQSLFPGDLGAGKLGPPGGGWGGLLIATIL